MLFNRILLITIIIIVIYTLIIILSLPKETKKESPEERKDYYLKLQNMTTQEILLFKRKEDFIKDVGCYDILREFYNDNQIIEKVYPNYKRLD